MLVILAPQEAKIRKIAVLQSQLRQTVCKTLFQKSFHLSSQKKAGGVVQGVTPKFKPQYWKKKKKKKN
jgi:hypothetical protein